MLYMMPGMMMVTDLVHLLLVLACCPSMLSCRGLIVHYQQGYACYYG